MKEAASKKGNGHTQMEKEQRVGKQFHFCKGSVVFFGDIMSKCKRKLLEIVRRKDRRTIKSGCTVEDAPLGGHHEKQGIQAEKWIAVLWHNAQKKQADAFAKQRIPFRRDFCLGFQVNREFDGGEIYGKSAKTDQNACQIAAEQIHNEIDHIGCLRGTEIITTV